MDKEIIRFFNNLKAPNASPAASANLFDMGARGLFENPFTKILARFLGMDSKYSRRDVFIRQFTQSLVNNKAAADSFLNELHAETQIRTKTEIVSI
jgi:hypothetical protein